MKISEVHGRGFMTPDRENPQHSWISQAGLRARGWTPKLIESFLGASDRTAPNPHYRSAPPMRLWAIERVEAVEQDPRFQQALQEARRRQAGAKQAVERKRELTMAAARTLPLNVQRIPLKQLAKEARLHYFERTGEYPRFEPWGTPDPFRDRLCVNYLRHQASPYDEHLEELSGRVGIGKAYLILWKRIVEAIEAAYPVLGKEARQQYREREKLLNARMDQEEP